MADSSPRAPGDLELVRTFVNTLDIDDADDSLRDPGALRAWLADRALVEGDEPLSAAELRQAIEVREALRLLLLANNDAPLDPEAVETLNAAGKRAELAVRFGDAGDGSLAPLRAGFDGALARLLAIVYESMADGTWPRLKACAAHNCEWAFYDTSRNRSRTWCDMAVCGNREKARAYRERRRGDG